jgi:hypothetical protein
MQSVAEAFESPEYFAFKDNLTKASLDKSIKIKNSHLVYGKNVKEVPSFKAVDDVKSSLQASKTKLLLQLNDLYDRIISAASPDMYKSQYETLIRAIEVIDAKIDEVDAFISSQNEKLIYEPLRTIEHELETNKVKAESIIQSVRNDVHIDKSKITNLLTHHKKNINLLQKLTEAKNAVEMDYIIWKDVETSKPSKTSSSSRKLTALLSTATSSSPKRTRLSSIKKQSIKSNVKQLMKDRL